MGITKIEERLNELQKDFQDMQEEAGELAKEVDAKYKRLQNLQVLLLQLEGRVQEVSGMLSEAKKQEIRIVEV